MDASRNDCSSCCWGAELKSSLESLRLHQRIITWTESSVALSPDKSLLKTSKPLPWLPKTHRTETDRTIWLTELWATARHRPHPQARRNQGIPSASVMQRRSNCLRQDPHYPYKYNVREPTPGGLINAANKVSAGRLVMKTATVSVAVASLHWWPD